MDIKVVAPDVAATAIRSGNWRGQGRIGGCLDLSSFNGVALPHGLHCHDLNLRNAAVTRLPDDLRIDSRLVLDECSALADLPKGLAAGSISARNCTSLRALPEGITTWFLDLTGATSFETWPKHGLIQNFLRVPPSTRTCRQAAAWMAGFENEALYHPKIET